MARMMSWSTFVIRLSWIVGTYAREMFAGETLPVLNARLPSLAVEKADAAGVPSGMVRENWPPGTAAPTAAYRRESRAWSAWTEVLRSASYSRAGITEMTAAWRNSTAHSSAKRVATVDATPSESSRNEFAIENGCPRKALFKYLVRSKSFVITSRRNRSGNRFQQCRTMT